MWCNRAKHFSSIFLDDILLFAKAFLDAFRSIKNMLAWYEEASGQMVNFSKSTICFGSQIKVAARGNMVGIICVNVVNYHKKYLGIPCFAGKDKKSLFASIKDRVWNSKLFPVGGRSDLKGGDPINSGLFHESFPTPMFPH